MKVEAVLLGVILVGSFICILGDPVGDRKTARETSETADNLPEGKQPGGAGDDGSPPANSPAGEKPPASVPTPNNSDNCTETNGTSCETVSNISQSMGDRIKTLMDEHKGMLMRSFYVLIGVTGIVIIYFIVRTVRIQKSFCCGLRSKRSKSKKYGVIATSGSDNLEMTPLDQDDDDEDLTVFEVNGRR